MDLVPDTVGGVGCVPTGHDMKYCHKFVHLMGMVTPFIQEHHPRWRDSTDAEIAWYCAWFWDRDLMSVSVINEEIYGVCTIKLFDKLGEFLDPHPFNPTGKFCFIDLLVSVSPTATANVFQILVDRWGPQEIVLWDRGERTEGGAPRMFSWAQFMKLSSRLTYGVIESETVRK